MLPDLKQVAGCFLTQPNSLLKFNGISSTMGAGAKGFAPNVQDNNEALDVLMEVQWTLQTYCEGCQVEIIASVQIVYIMGSLPIPFVMFTWMCMRKSRQHPGHQEVWTRRKGEDWNWRSCFWILEALEVPFESTWTQPEAWATAKHRTPDQTSRSFAVKSFPFLLVLQTLEMFTNSYKHDKKLSRKFFHASNCLDREARAEEIRLGFQKWRTTSNGMLVENVGITKCEFISGTEIAGW